MGNSNVIDKLRAFRQRDKFSAEVWRERGLNPSDNELCETLTGLFNSCADELIEAVGRQHTRGQLRSILARNLSRFKKWHYDSEEKEFIADLFYELSGILDIDFRHKLNSWLQGALLANLYRFVSLVRGPEKVVETLSQDCDACGAKLETLILEKRDLPDYGWDIIQCNNCDEFNLIDKGANVARYRSKNYRYVETLAKDEYSRDQAMLRLEQIRMFRRK